MAGDGLKRALRLAQSSRVTHTPSGLNRADVGQKASLITGDGRTEYYVHKTRPGTLRLCEGGGGGGVFFTHAPTLPSSLSNR